MQPELNLTKHVYNISIQMHTVYFLELIREGNKKMN